MPELTRLHVIGVRYRNDQLAPDDERALDAMAASGAYEEALVPFDVFEPRLAERQLTGVQVEDVGTLCGLIAVDVSAALSSGSAVLMTGGNCVHALGVIGGLEDTLDASARIGLVWLDAHGDFNTPGTNPSGSLGGMPVAVAAGLAYPEWRERAHVVRPLPTDRILLAGCRDLDDDEERLIQECAVQIVEIRPPKQEPCADIPGLGRDAGGGTALDLAVNALAERSDVIYVHIDIDVLDETFVPGHRSGTAGGPGIADVLAAIDVVMSTRKVRALAVVSTSVAGERGDVTVSSAVELIRGGLRSWRAHGVPSLHGGGS